MAVSESAPSPQSSSVPVESSAPASPAPAVESAPAPAPEVATPSAAQPAEAAPPPTEPVPAEGGADEDDGSVDAIHEAAEKALAEKAAQPPAQPPVEVPKFAHHGALAEALASGKIPEAARPWVQASLDTIKPLEQRVLTAESEYSQAKERFLKAASEIEGQGAQGAKVMASRTAELVDNFSALTEKHATLTVKHFEASHPDYVKAGPKHPARQFMAKMWADGTAGRVFKGDLIDQMEESWKYSLFQTGTTLAQAGSQSKQPTTPPGEDDAIGGALVNDGQHGTQRPVPDVDDVSVEEILAQHDYLLN